MKVFNLYGGELDDSRDREGWRVKAAVVGRNICGELIGAGGTRTRSALNAATVGGALRAPGRLVEQASLVHERHSLQAAAHAELREDVLDVRGQRPWADDELVRDLG
jgi:hypothetical protein